MVRQVKAAVAMPILAFACSQDPCGICVLITFDPDAAYLEIRRLEEKEKGETAAKMEGSTWYTPTWQSQAVRMKGL